MAIDLSSGLSAIAVDSFSGKTHIVWVDNGFLWHAVYDENAQKWVEGESIAYIGSGKVTNLNLVADSLVKSGDSSSHGLVITWQQGEDNDSDIYYTSGRYVTDGELQWLNTPQPLTSDHVADLDSEILFRPDTASKGILVVESKINTENADNLGITEDSDLYIQQFSVTSDLFPTYTSPYLKTSDSRAVQPDLTVDLPPTDEEDKSNSDSEAYQGLGTSWNVSLEFSSSDIKDWGLYNAVPDNVILQGLTEGFFKDVTISGAIKGSNQLTLSSFGQDAAVGDLSLDLSASGSYGKKVGDEFNYPWEDYRDPDSFSIINTNDEEFFLQGAGGLVVSQKKQNKVTVTVNLGTNYKYASQDPFNLKSITNSFGITVGLVNIPIVTREQTYGWGDIKFSGSLGFNTSLKYVPTDNSGNYYPKNLYPGLFSIGAGTGTAVAGGVITGLVLKGAKAGSIAYVGLLGTTVAATMAGFINGFASGLDLDSGVVTFPIISTSITGTLSPPSPKPTSTGQVQGLPFPAVILKGGVDMSFGWGLTPKDPSVFNLAFPLSATLKLFGPLKVGFGIKPSFKWTMIDSNVTESLPKTTINGNDNLPASVEGSLLTIDLKQEYATLPEADDFTVKVFDISAEDSNDFTVIPVFNVVPGKTKTQIVLQLEQEISPSLNYDYTTSDDPTPTSDQIRVDFNNQEQVKDIQGNTIPSFVNVEVENNTPITNSYSYRPTSGTDENYNYPTLKLDFTVPLDTNNVPNPSQFSVTLRSTGNPITGSIQGVLVKENQVTLLFDSFTKNTDLQDVTVKYNNQSATDQQLKQPDFIDENGDTVKGEVISSFEINNGLNAQVSQSVIIIDDLNPSTSLNPSLTQSNVTVLADGTNYLVTNIEQQGNTTILYLNDSIPANTETTITYGTGTQSLKIDSQVSASVPPAIDTTAFSSQINFDYGLEGTPVLAQTSLNSILAAWISEVPLITPIAAFIRGREVTLTFADPIDNKTQNQDVPPNPKFTVSDGTTNYQYSNNVEIKGNSLVITLQEVPLQPSQIKVSYEQDKTNINNNYHFSDSTNTKLWIDDFFQFPVEVGSGINDSPNIIGAASMIGYSNNNQEFFNLITLVFDQDVTTANNSEFLVESNGVKFDVVDNTNVDGRNTLILKAVPSQDNEQEDIPLIGAGDVVTVTYQGNTLKAKANNNIFVTPFTQSVITAPPEPTTVLKYGFGPVGNNFLSSAESILGSSGLNFDPTVIYDDATKNNVIAWIHSENDGIDNSNLIAGEYYTDEDAQDSITNNLVNSDVYFAIYDSQGNRSIAAPIAQTDGSDGSVTLGKGPNNQIMAAWLNVDDDNIAEIYWSSLNYVNGKPLWSEPEMLFEASSPDPLTELRINSLNGQPAVFWTESKPLSYSNLTTSESPLVYFRLSESYGTVAINEGIWGDNADGVYEGNIQYQEDGALKNLEDGTGDANEAVKFEPGSSMTVPNDIFLYSNSFSVDFWFKVDNTPSGIINLVDLKNLASISLNGNTLSLNLSLETPISLTKSLDNELLKSQEWIYVSATYDGEQEIATLYVNGQPVATQTGITFDSFLIFNEDLTGSANYFTNIILAGETNQETVYLDEVAFYDSVLSYSELTIDDYLNDPDLTGYQIQEILFSSNDIGSKYEAQYTTPVVSGPQTYYLVYDSEQGEWENSSFAIDPSLKIVPTTLADANLRKWDVVSNKNQTDDRISPDGNEDTLYEINLGSFGIVSGLTVTAIQIEANGSVWSVGSGTTGRQLGVIQGNNLLNNLTSGMGNEFSHKVLSNAETLILAVDGGSSFSFPDLANITVKTETDSITGTAQKVTSDGQPVSPGSAPVIGVATVSEANDYSLANIDSGFVIDTTNPAVGAVIVNGNINGQKLDDSSPANQLIVGNRGYVDDKGQPKNKGSIQVLFPGSGGELDIYNGKVKDAPPNPLTPPDPKFASGVVAKEFTITGIEDYGDSYGDFPWTMTMADLNKDGFDDFIIATPNVNNKQGVVYVIYGSQNFKPGTSIDLTNGKIPSNAQGYIIQAPQEDIENYLLFGFSVDVGNFDGDGKLDIIIGAPGANEQKGNVYVSYGKDAGLNGGTVRAKSIYRSQQMGELAGYAVAVSTAVDGGSKSFTGNSSDDVIIGAPGFNATITNLWDGYNGLPKGANDQDSFPSTDTAQVGKTYIFKSNGGVNNTFMTDPTFTYQGSDQPSSKNGTAYDSLAGSVLTSDDWDGDGIKDLAISAPTGNDGNGLVYILKGGKAGVVTNNKLDGVADLTIVGGLPNGQTGTVITSVGDVNPPSQSKGYADLLITTPQGIFGTGQSHIVFGSGEFFDNKTFELNAVENGDKKTVVLNGISPYQLSGNSGSGIGDINDDQVNDLVVSTPYGNQISTVYGHPWLADIGGLKLAYLSSTNGFVIDGNSYVVNSVPLAGNGRTSTMLGDINGDGAADVFSGGQRQGAVIVFGQGSQSLSVNQNDLVISKNFGTGDSGLSGDQIPISGDFNGDGLMDFILNVTDSNGNDVAYYLILGNSSLSSLNTLKLSPDIGIPYYDFSNGKVNSVSVNAYRTGDVNGDGYDDILFKQIPISNGSQTSYSMYWGNQEGSFTAKDFTPLSLDKQEVRGGGDVDGDGYSDLIKLIRGAETSTSIGNTANYSSSLGPSNIRFNELKTLFGNSTRKLTEAQNQLVNTSGNVFYGTANGKSTNTSSMGDFNGDGINDLIVGKDSSSLLQAWKSNDDNKIRWNYYDYITNEMLVPKLDMGQNSTASPSLASFKGKSYMAFEGDSSNSIYIFSLSQDGNNKWSGIKLSDKYQTTAGPSLVSTSDFLYLGFKGKSTSNFYISSSQNGTTWSLPVTDNSSKINIKSGPVSLAASGDNLYLAWLGSDNSINISYLKNPSDPNSWASTKTQLSSSSGISPSLVSLNGKLYLAWKEKDNFTYWASTDTSTDVTQLFSNAQKNLAFGSNVVGGTSSSGPTLTASNGTLYMSWAYNGKDSDLTDLKVVNNGEGLTGSLTNGILYSALINGQWQTPIRYGPHTSGSRPTLNPQISGAEVSVVMGSPDVENNGSTSNVQIGYFSAIDPYNSSNVDNTKLRPDTSLANELTYIGDVNGDGFDDILINQPQGVVNSNSNTGIMYVVFGTDSQEKIDLNELIANQFGGSSDKGFVITGLPNSQSGISISGGEDVNGDGFDDMVIGAPGNDDNLTYVVYGSDFTNIVNQIGTSGNDIMLGSPTGETFVGDQGSDRIYTNGGIDVAYGAMGDDYITVSDIYFRRLDGGAGNDVLVFEGSKDQDWDLTTLSPGLRLRDFEILVTENYGANILTLNSLTVTQLSSNNILTVVMDEQDTLMLSSDFSLVIDNQGNPDTVYHYSRDFYKYKSNKSAATILVNINNVPDPAQSGVSLTNIPQDIIYTPSTNNSELLEQQSNISTEFSSFLTVDDDYSRETFNSFEEQVTQLSVSSPKVSEVDEQATFTIRRTGDLNNYLWVQYITRDRDGKAGNRYLPTFGRALFEPNQMEQTITVDIPNDDVYTGEQQFELLVSSIAEEKTKEELPTKIEDLSYNYKLTVDANGEQIRHWSNLLSNPLHEHNSLNKIPFEFRVTTTNGQAEIKFYLQSEKKTIVDFSLFNGITNKIDKIIDDGVIVNNNQGISVETFDEDNDNFADGVIINIDDNSPYDSDSSENGLIFQQGYLSFEDTSEDLLNTPMYRFRTGDATYIYVGEEERESILEGGYNFVEEGEAFKVATQFNELLNPIYRFRNNDFVGAYLYAGEEERQSIRENYTNFIEEGLAFYVYGADAQQADDIYRFQTQPGGYIFVGEAERESILEGDYNFTEEGIAFEALS
ncbi:Calx-beta domain-containing protein [Cyanobacterium sp. DS4]|uniref:Calx-beta domain-containing protein n=1 Tax=Cyanobacterium sp. DS4 TaxID=2878255 RepID=UPI002E824A95|nr:Calx-beta domain-containing protein [Cyanobacterium sp. Dongsha4]WVK99237.1 FG-GAP-like repeat-containing protein [Cyanobacterium sp. Dongsha4]